MNRRLLAKIILCAVLAAICGMLISLPANAQNGVMLPKINLGIEKANSPKDVATSLQILFILTILSLAPALLMMMTSFTRIIIVLSFTRTAIGSPQVPPNSVLIGLALFLTFFTMAPIWSQINKKALQPYISQKINFNQAIDIAQEPIKEFMLKQTRQKDIALFVNLSKMPKPKDRQDLQMSVLIPAFLISELKTAFTIGFVIFIPFLVVDMVVSIILMSMGMMMLPPMLISLPFKILLFVLVDGWHLIARSLAMSFH